MDPHLYDPIARALAETPAGRVAMRRALALARADDPGLPPTVRGEHVEPGRARWRLHGDRLSVVAAPASPGRAYVRSVSLHEFAAACRTVADLSLVHAGQPGTLLSIKVERRPQSAIHRGALVLSLLPRHSCTSDRTGDRGSVKGAFGERGSRVGWTQVMPISRLQAADAILRALTELHPVRAESLVARGRGDGMGTQTLGQRRGSFSSGPRVLAIADATGMPPPPEEGSDRVAWLDSFAGMLVRGITDQLQRAPIDTRRDGMGKEDHSHG